MLSTKNIPPPIGIWKKLSPKYIGPFTIIERNASGRSYRLDLSDEYTVHPVFQVSLLKPYHEDLLSRAPPWKVRFNVSDTRSIVHRITTRGTSHGEVEFLVHYKDTDASKDQWIAQKALNEMKQKGRMYHKYQDIQFATAVEDASDSEEEGVVTVV